MRSFVLALLASIVLAGCVGLPSQDTSSEAAAPASGTLAVAINFDDRNTYYEGDEVELAARASQGADITWDLGDGNTAEGPDVLHAYAAGIYTVTATATRDGASASDSIDVTVLDLFGNAPAPVAPPEPSATPTGYIVTLPNGEPTVGETVVLQLDGPHDGAGSWTVFIGEAEVRADFEALPATVEVPTDSAGRTEWLWHAEVGEDIYATVAFDVWGEPIEWSEPTAEQWLRPGVHSEVCTVNFLFHYKHYRYFIGSAAHCIDDAEGGCLDEAVEAGRAETLHAHDASKSTKDAWVVYNAWATMDRVGTSGEPCDGNDFALIELGPKAQQFMHPKAMFFGGPTAMADIEGYASGTRLYGYGASNLHGNAGIGYPGQTTVNQKQGVSLGTTEGGFTQHLYFALPGVPGDSGGPAFGPGGEALGAASRVAILPVTGSNFYTVIPKALEFMEQHEGWAPELVTYDDWSGLGS